MMLRTQLDWGGAPTAQIGPWWWKKEFHPVERLNGQLTGLGMTTEEARQILAVGTYSGTYTQAQVDEAQKVYYGGASAGSYQSQVAVQPKIIDCGPEPVQPSVTLMSSPSCSANDGACVMLNQAIAAYNSAVANNAMNAYLRAGCERQNCQNQGSPGYPRNCSSIYPPVPVPPQPVYPGAVPILQQNGVVTGYSNQPIGSSTAYGSYGSGSGSGSGGGGSTDEVSQAHQIYVDLLSRYGVAANSAVTDLFNREFSAGVEWYKNTYGSYNGLANYVRANADSVVQGWMRTAGVTKADGTPTKPNTSGSGTQPGNTQTGGGGARESGDKSVSESSSSGGIFIALGAVALLMLAGGKK